MACGLTYLAATLLLCCATILHSTNAAPWMVTNPAGPESPTVLPNQIGPSDADPVPVPLLDFHGSLPNQVPDSDSDSDSGGFINPFVDAPPANDITDNGELVPFPGFVQGKPNDQGNAKAVHDSVSDTNATDSSSGNPQGFLNFDFSSNTGDSMPDIVQAPFIDSPWISSLPNQDGSSGQHVGLVLDEEGFFKAIGIQNCGDLCHEYEDICSGNDKCVVTENCTAMCNKADGSQVLLEPTNLRPAEERRCSTTGELCVHGTCQDGQNCVCDLGYEGPLCADKQCQLPCKNGGVCFKSDFQQLQCQCAEGWQGPICGEKACTLRCVRGSCRYTTPMEMSIRGSSVYCNCPNGWRGRLCDEVIPDPAASSKKLALVIGVAAPCVCVLVLVISWYILWRKRVIFVFKIINMFKAYEDNDDKDYDAYVSLTGADYVFAKQVLQPKLEEMGHKLYIHAKDSKPGDVKSEGILEAVEKSRRCIMLLSSDYISNEWCRFEYLIAQHETCIKLKQRIIPILIDDIDNDKKKMDKTLRFIVDSVKCLRYPKPPVEQTSPLSTKEQTKFEKKLDKFWERMRLSMPKKRDAACKEESPFASTGSKLSYDKTTGFRSLFSKLSNVLPVSGGQAEKSSATDLSFIEPSSSAEKLGETNPVALISVSALDPKLDSFYTGTLEKNVSTNCSESRFVVVDGDVQTTGGDSGNIHLKF